ARLVIGVSRHQQRLSRPVRVRMLAIDFLEALRGVVGLVLVVQKVQALVVELVGGLIDERLVLLAEDGVPPAADRTAGAEWDCGRDQAGDPGNAAERPDRW